MQSQEPLFTTPANENDTGAMVDETPQAWFVELASRPSADGTSVATLKNEKAAFRAEAKNAKLKYTERYAFDTLWNGISVRISPSQLATLRAIPGVKAIYPVTTVSLPPGGGAASPDLTTALALTGADIAQNSLGLTGAGVKVAVMDTGIDIDHPDFGGSGVNGTTAFPTARIIAGYDFVGDAYDANPANPTYNPVPVPDNNPDDCAGHGTHVAGIIGANGTIKGVAPGVKFGAYRVFGCAGSTDTDVMIAAMERALADKMDVLNMSIGSAFESWPQAPTAQAASRLVGKGMVVVASIGNSGTSGLYAAGAPGVGSRVIGVASVDNTSIKLLGFTITPDNKANGYTQATAAPTAPTSGSFPMSRTGTQTTANDACAALPAGSLTGTVALIRRGTCGFYNKAIAAQNAGASAVVIYNNVAGPAQNITVAPVAPATAPVTIPVVAISQADGNVIDTRLAGGPVTMTWTSQVVNAANATGGLISGFSSYGLDAELNVKPDITAPGGFIRSTIPLEQGAFGNNSGTSMASPHVAGTVALLLQARPTTNAGDVRAILQNTSSPRLWFGNPGLGFLENVHRQGAGLVQIDKAVLSTTTVNPGSLALGESQGGPVTRTLTIANNGVTSVTYDLSNVGALATGPNTFVPSFLAAFATAAFSSPSVTVQPGGTATVDVTLTAPAGLASKGLYGGFIVLTPQGGGQVYRVPYAGLKDDYQAIQVLTPTANGFPWLAKLNAGTFTNQPGGASYSMVGDDVPQFLVHFDHQARLVEFEIVDANTNVPIHDVFHNAMEFEYFSRNASSGGFFSFAWDGTRLHSNGNQGKTKFVPNGQYKIVLKVLKALGDPNDPAHTETWTSPVVTIARP
ncbi:MAG TPA: S8 family serine peptidase [Pyrinomonadaceae bacterium]|nr:S8 family serine peptidase [Pyrinomonadaceae bacterium]